MFFFFIYESNIYNHRGDGPWDIGAGNRDGGSNQTIAHLQKKKQSGHTGRGGRGRRTSQNSDFARPSDDSPTAPRILSLLIIVDQLYTPASIPTNLSFKACRDSRFAYRNPQEDVRRCFVSRMLSHVLTPLAVCLEMASPSGSAFVLGSVSTRSSRFPCIDQVRWYNQYKKNWADVFAPRRSRGLSHTFVFIREKFVRSLAPCWRRASS